MQEKAKLIPKQVNFRGFAVSLTEKGNLFVIGFKRATYHVTLSKELKENFKEIQKGNYVSLKGNFYTMINGKKAFYATDGYFKSCQSKAS